MSYPLEDPYLAQSLAAYTLRPGIDYEPAVCNVCGEDEHTPEQLADCIESALVPMLSCVNCGAAVPATRDECGACGAWM